MSRTPVIAIFDVGKTNKKLLLFDEQYQLIKEDSCQLAEIKDEDGFECEDVIALTNWLKESFDLLLADDRYEVKAVNFSGYGASFVYLDKGGNVIPHLYNYLKPYPQSLQKKFYQTYGGESVVAKQTASPVLGNLNSGMQLYRIKYEQPEKFARIKYALHLPQYLSYILTLEANAEITSIGCHTNLWDFQQKKYHQWVMKENIAEKFPSIKDSTSVAGKTKNGIPAGVGLHDSSAALIPYLSAFTEPFILLSTGTWSISINPFNHSQLSDYELHHDCLCYLSFQGKPVKASRLFAGYEHEQQVKKLAAHFKTEPDHYKKVKPDSQLIKKITPGNTTNKLSTEVMVGQSEFSKRDLKQFKSYDEAYHQLIADIIEQQVKSTSIVLKGSPVKKIFVDGGFSKNLIYMRLLALSFPGIKVYAASIAQASAIGAALAIHKIWNNKNVPSDIIELKEIT
jgi:sugar (pentulose or hexulose) kinase